MPIQVTDEVGPSGQAIYRDTETGVTGPYAEIERKNALAREQQRRKDAGFTAAGTRPVSGQPTFPGPGTIAPIPSTAPMPSLPPSPPRQFHPTVMSEATQEQVLPARGTTPASTGDPLFFSSGITFDPKFPTQGLFDENAQRRLRAEVSGFFDAFRGASGRAPNQSEMEQIITAARDTWSKSGNADAALSEARNRIGQLAQSAAREVQTQTTTDAGNKFIQEFQDTYTRLQADVTAKSAEEKRLRTEGNVKAANVLKLEREQRQQQIADLDTQFRGFESSQAKASELYGQELTPEQLAALSPQERASLDYLKTSVSPLERGITRRIGTAREEATKNIREQLASRGLLDSGVLGANVTELEKGLGEAQTSAIEQLLTQALGRRRQEEVGRIGGEKQARFGEEAQDVQSQLSALESELGIDLSALRQESALGRERELGQLNLMGKTDAERAAGASAVSGSRIENLLQDAIRQGQTAILKPPPTFGDQLLQQILPMLLQAGSGAALGPLAGLLGGVFGGGGTPTQPKTANFQPNPFANVG